MHRSLNARSVQGSKKLRARVYRWIHRPPTHVRAYNQGEIIHCTTLSLVSIENCKPTNSFKQAVHRAPILYCGQTSSLPHHHTAWKNYWHTINHYHRALYIVQSIIKSLYQPKYLLPHTELQDTMRAMECSCDLIS